ncbi:MAG: hypothetical protein ANABAC_0070 [Anaerolineae bacterium]|nr:MAG: hypothetical protein ANABAC_0070 [Anaerolineae bacterium]
MSTSRERRVKEAGVWASANPGGKIRKKLRQRKIQNAFFMMTTLSYHELFPLKRAC